MVVAVVNNSLEILELAAGLLGDAFSDGHRAVEENSDLRHHRESKGERLGEGMGERGVEG